MNVAPYFMRCEEYQPAEPHPESPFVLFAVSCLKCKSHRIKVISEHDSDSGQLAAYLFCPSCRQCERLPMR